MPTIVFGWMAATTVGAAMAWPERKVTPAARPPATVMAATGSPVRTCTPAATARRASASAISAPEQPSSHADISSEAVAISRKAAGHTARSTPSRKPCSARMSTRRLGRFRSASTSPAVRVRGKERRRGSHGVGAQARHGRPADLHDEGDRVGRLGKARGERGLEPLGRARQIEDLVVEAETIDDAASAQAAQLERGADLEQVEEIAEELAGRGRAEVVNAHRTIDAVSTIAAQDAARPRLALDQGDAQAEPGENHRGRQTAEAPADDHGVAAHAKTSMAVARGPNSTRSNRRFGKGRGVSPSGRVPAATARPAMAVSGGTDARVPAQAVVAPHEPRGGQLPAEPRVGWVKGEIVSGRASEHDGIVALGDVLGEPVEHGHGRVAGCLAEPTHAGSGGAIVGKQDEGRAAVRRAGRQGGLEER